jgi:hypothetical protein
MGNALRLLCGQSNEPTTTEVSEFLGHHGVSAATVGLSALAHDLFHFEITSQVDISMFYFPCYYNSGLLIIKKKKKNSGLLLFFFQQVRRVFKLQNPSSPKRIGQYYSDTKLLVFHVSFYFRGTYRNVAKMHNHP